MNIVEKIQKLKEEKNAIILANNYQPGEIQDLADINGDSLELARIAAKNDAEVIVFCGVHFMAESAKILSPQKTVLLPAFDAGCPMADMANEKALADMKAIHPNAKVVTYINSTAATKALSDVICTSSNAVKIVQKIDAEEIIFVPDKNLGRYVQRFTDKKIILWDGYCPVHNEYTVEKLNAVRKQHPDALFMVHPECPPEIIDQADEVFSTGQMVAFVQDTSAEKIIVGTESGMIHRLKQVVPHIKYIPASDDFLCRDMKKITMQVLFDSLREGKTEIHVDAQTADNAKKALEAMLRLS